MTTARLPDLRRAAAVRKLTQRDKDLLLRLCATGEFMRLHQHELEIVDRLEKGGLVERAWFSTGIYKATEKADKLLFGAPIE